VQYAERKGRKRCQMVSMEEGVLCRLQGIKRKEKQHTNEETSFAHCSVTHSHKLQGKVGVVGGHRVSDQETSLKARQSGQQVHDGTSRESSFQPTTNRELNRFRQKPDRNLSETSGRGQDDGDVNYRSQSEP